MAGAQGAADRLDDQGLFLDVVLNHVPLHRLGWFVLVRGKLHATPRTLRELGLTWPGEDGTDALVALDALPGVRSRYDAAQQRVYLDVPVSMLVAPPVAIGYRAPPAPRLDPATRAPGLLLNYSLWAQGNDGHRSVSTWQELRLFGVGPGVWRSSSLLSSHHGEGDDRSDAVRLDTSWQLDFPERMISVVVGDTWGSGPDWTRSVRFGGVRVSRNFGLQPYRVTVPLASYAGEAVLPSTVDLYIDGIRQARQAVMPGRFQIDSAPVLGGVGNAQVVVTDITGQSRVVDFSIYNARHLLQRGLSDWSLEAGALRRGYGSDSFSYASDAMGRGSLRHGVRDFLTVEAHAEATRGLRMGGVGAMLRLGHAGGVLSASWARSQHAYADDGTRYGLGYEWQSRRFSVSASTLRRDDDFHDVASVEGSLLPLRSDRAYLGLNLGNSQVGAGYVRQDLPGETRARYATLSASQRLHRRAHLGLSLSRDLDGGTGTVALLHLSLLLDDDRQAWASAQRRDSGHGLVVGARRALPVEAGGWGWRAQAGTGDNAGGQAEIGRASEHGQWNAGALVWRGDGTSDTTGYFEASGGLLWMRGGLFPMRQAFDAFALVSTGSIAGVPVMLENRPVGRTDARGLLLVAPLNAWQDNDLSIDPLVLPADVSVERTRMQAVPATGSGMLARFPMRGVVAVQLALRGPDGRPIPAGSPAELIGPDGSVTPVASIGYDGQAFLEDPPGGARLRITLERGQCTATLPDALPQRGWVELGELPCR
ncbi:fimbria/pilus outer membrane usher protein [Luteimonas sp. A482]